MIPGDFRRIFVISEEVHATSSNVLQFWVDKYFRRFLVLTGLWHNSKILGANELVDSGNGK